PGIGRQRLGDRGGEAGRQQCRVFVLLARGGMRDGRRLQPACAQPRQQFAAAAIGQPGIEQPQRVWMGGGERERFGHAGRRIDHGRQRFGRRLQERAAGGIVLDQQDPWIHRRPLRSGYARPMPWRILTLLLLVLAAGPAPARTATARIDSIDAAGVALRDVRVRLHWPAHAAQGELRIQAARIEAPTLGYRFDDVRWHCPLARPQDETWRCEGPLQGRGHASLRLAVDLSPASTDALLASGDARLALHRSAASPDATQLQLTRVPMLWAQALLANAWAGGRLAAGTMDGEVRLLTPSGRPLQVEGRLGLAGLGLESDDGTIALGDVDGRVRFDLRVPEDSGMLLSLDGEVDRGEALFGNAYLALGGTPVAFGVDARQVPGGGWSAARVEWRDPRALDARGSAGLDAQGGLRTLALDVHSDSLAALPDRYLSGWLGLAGLSG